MTCFRIKSCKLLFDNCKPDAFQTTLSLLDEDSTSGHAYLSCCTHYSLVLLVRALISNVDLLAGTADLALEAVELYESTTVFGNLFWQVEHHPWRVVLGHRWQCEFGVREPGSIRYVRTNVHRRDSVPHAYMCSRCVCALVCLRAHV